MKKPETVLRAFLKAWVNQDRKKMHIHTTKTWQSAHNKNHFAAKDLESFEILEQTQNTHHADFKLLLNGESMQCRLVCERAPYRTSSKEQDESDIDLCKTFGISANVAWGVAPQSFRPCQS